jgi:hypothetical protein
MMEWDFGEGSLVAWNGYLGFVLIFLIPYYLKQAFG